MRLYINSCCLCKIASDHLFGLRIQLMTNNNARLMVSIKDDDDLLVFAELQRQMPSMIVEPDATPPPAPIPRKKGKTLANWEQESIKMVLPYSIFRRLKHGFNSSRNPKFKSIKEGLQIYLSLTLLFLNITYIYLLYHHL